VDPKLIEQVCTIISKSSYKGAKVEDAMDSPEGAIVQDADRLDAIGAIGIARSFAYGGHAGREIYNPTISPQLHKTAASYKSNTSPTINHFYEKLLLLKDGMHTTTAKRMAEEQHQYMETFLTQFYTEWNGKR
jgi:uncharacterized protein